MAYALKSTIDTWLKLSTSQGDALPEDQKHLLAAGTVLPLSSFQVADAGHLKVTLGKDAAGQQIFFKGRNTWYVYRAAVQVLRDGQQVDLPDARSGDPISISLKPLTDTWLKQNTAQGSALPANQRQFIRAGELLPLESYAAADNDHLKLTLGRDTQGKQVQFQGRNTWYVYRPAVQIVQNEPTPQPTPAPAPQPTPTPAPTPVRSAYAIKTMIDTWLKQSTGQGSSLPANQRQFIGSGSVLPIASYGAADNDHLKLTLGVDAKGEQIFFQGRNTWYVYRPSVQILKDGQVISTPSPAPSPTPTSPTPTSGQINAKGLRLLKSFEGLRLTAYQDSVGVWTIGYGTTSNVRPGMKITEAEAEALLKRDLARFERAVSDLVTVPLNSDQFSALVSFTYNVGEGALASSTLLRLLNQRDYRGAADQLLRWDKAGGRSLPGLTRRRQAERALFLGQDYTAFL